MNKTKRGFELAGSIIVIIIASFLIIGCLYCLVSWDTAKSLMEDIYGEDYFSGMFDGIMKSTFVFLLIYGVALVVLSSLLLPSPYKNGEYKKRTGIKITFLILVGIFALISFDSILLFLIIIASFVFVLLSLVLKGEVVEGGNGNLNNEEYDKIGKLQELRDKGTITEEQYQEAVKKIIDKM